MSIFTYSCLSTALFQNQGFSDSYIHELYNYALDIEVMKLIHSILLVAICAFIYNTVRQNRVLTRKQYSQILLMTCFISMLYFVPCLYIVKITYDRQKLTQQGGQMFLDWLSILVTASENNVYGVIVSVLIHA